MNNFNLNNQYKLRKWDFLEKINQPIKISDLETQKKGSNQPLKKKSLLNKKQNLSKKYAKHKNKIFRKIANIVTKMEKN